MPEIRDPQAITELQDALKPESQLPSLYFNGFIASVTPADIILVLKHRDLPVLTLECSHQVGKTLVRLLGDLIVGFETELRNEILTTQEIKDRLGHQFEGAEKNDE